MKSKIKTFVFSITFFIVILGFVSKYDLIIGLGLSFLAIGLLYYIQSFIEIFLYFMFNKKIQYFIIYPFAYDGKIKFAPIKLLYRNELYFNKLSGNLFIHIGNNLNRKTIELITIEYLSKFISTAFIGILFYLVNYNIFIELLVLLLGTIIASLIYEDIYYNSLFATYKKNEMKEKLLSLFFIKGNNYSIIKKYLIFAELNNKYILDILISLNKNAILYDVELIDINTIDTLINKVSTKNKTIMYDIKLMNIYYLIGFIGKKYGDLDYINYSYEKIQNEIRKILNLEGETIINMKKTKNVLMNFQEYLRYNNKVNEIEKYIYYYNDSIFEKEHNFVNSLNDILK